MIETSGSADFENPLCIVSQEWTYGIDNTGTSFADAGELKITLDDGRCLTWEQTPTSGWSAQLTQWAAGIQAAATALGLQWLVEPRFVDNLNPPNIDGTINGPGGTPSGLPGAPDPTIAVALINGGMAQRYANIQICPGEPVPVRAERITSADGRPVPYDLTTAGAVLGPKNRFRVFYERDKATDEPCETWYIYDLEHSADPRKRWREANAGEIPFCYFKDGDAASTAEPPEKTCEFRYTDGCDNNGSENLVDFTTGVIRRATFCRGEKIQRDFFVADPTDPTGLLSYDLQGKFVDCATGLVIPLDPPPCEDFVPVGILWRLKGDPTPGTLVEWWADPAGPVAGNGAPHGNVSDIFTNDGTTLSHVNGAPDRSYIAPFFSVEGTNTGEFRDGVGVVDNTDTSGTDQGKLSAYFILPANARLRDGGTRTGERGGMWLNQCCAGDLTLLEERTTDTTSVERGVFNGTVVPVGIHYAEAAISDLSAWWNLTLEASFDDGATYGPLLGFTSKPSYECVPVIKCKDTGVLLHADDGSVIEVGEFDQWCEPECVRSETAGSSASAEIDEAALADAIVTRQRDVTPRVQSWVNEGNDVVLTDATGNPYPAGTFGTLVSVTDFGTGLVRWSLDGSSPAGGDAPEYTTTGPYHSALNLDGVDLSLVRLNGSSANSDFSASWEVYN